MTFLREVLSSNEELKNALKNAKIKISHWTSCGQEGSRQSEWYNFGTSGKTS